MSAPTPSTDPLTGLLATLDLTDTGARTSEDIFTGPSQWMPGGRVFGGQVYAQAIDDADELVVTKIDGDYDVDVHAPEIGEDWTLVAREPGAGWTTAANGMRYAVERYERTGG